MLLGLMALLTTTPASAALSMRRALVIAHNGSDDPALAPLRFADDDGVMWAETLQRLGVETTLLVEPDDDTRQSGRPVLAGARAPTPEEVSREVARLRAAHLADRASGRESDVLIVYVGHGNTDDTGRAYFTLRGGRLDQTTLYTHVVDPLQASYVHVIVDACRASGVVGRRGQSDAAVVKEMRDMLAREQLASRPHVGVLFAESDNGETHEWSYIRAGVFSHLARSGLMGGADINSDRVVEYSELGAFVAASLQGVKEMPARLAVYTSAPARAPRRPLVGTIPHGPSLTLPADFKHTRIFVEDSEGRRLADVRRSSGQRLELHLPERDVYWVRTPTEDEVRLEVSQLGEEMPQLAPPEMRKRGPIEEALRRGLFAVPLDRAFYERYVSTRGLVPVDFPHPMPLTVPPEPAVPVTRAPDPIQLPRETIQWPAPPKPLPLPAPPRPGPSPRKEARKQVRVGWEVGLGVSGAPPGQEGVLTHVSAGAWHQAEGSPLSLGLRAGYGLTPFTPDTRRLTRASLQGVGGLQYGSREVVGFMEVAAGWRLFAGTYSDIPQGDPLVPGAQLAVGLGLTTAHGQLRLSGTWGVERFIVDTRAQWSPAYGVELRLRR